MNTITENKRCLACGNDDLQLSLDLGNQPLANNFLDLPSQQTLYPLSVNYCKHCYHVQLTHSVNPNIIYKNYLYAAGTSNTLKDYSNWFSNYVDENITKVTNNVLDIGCNDGTQLNSFKNIGFNTYGIDPAFKLANNNHKIISDFFNSDISLWENINFDAIVAQNVFAHNPNPYEFLISCKKIMDDHTLLFIQTSQADMIINNEFDTIYHEHINFFNIKSMNIICNRAGLNLVDVTKSPIHGVSYIFTISKSKYRPNTIKNFIEMENKLYNESTYETWQRNIKFNTKELKETIRIYRQMDYKIIGYGAAAKGNTLLNYINEPLDYILDDSVYKQNKFSPGLNIPIFSIQKLNELLESDKVLFVPLAWNFFKEIKEKIKKVRNKSNDKFCKYFPKVEIHV